MIEEMPSPCTRLLFGRMSDVDGVVYAARVDEMTHCRIADHPGAVREFNIPDINGFECTVWAELPAPDDPRWRVYDRTRNEGYPKWDQEVLCFAKEWFNPRAIRTTPWHRDNRIQYVCAPIGEEPHFPGFMGSPHQRDWGILKWMPLADAGKYAKNIPAEFLAKKTLSQHRQAERAIAVEHESENIFLSVINTGHCYKTMFSELCRKGPRWGVAARVDPKDGITSLQPRFAVAVQQAINYLVGKAELERDMNVWYDACNIARFKIAEYYYNHAKELQRA